MDGAEGGCRHQMAGPGGVLVPIGEGDLAPMRF